MAKYLFYII